jgi:hypothetical protein
MAHGVVQRDAGDGKAHVGVFTTADGMVQVTYLGVFPTQYTQIGGSTPEGLAGIMLTEFIPKK